MNAIADGYALSGNQCACADVILDAFGDYDEHNEIVVLKPATKKAWMASAAYLRRHPPPTRVPTDSEQEEEGDDEADESNTAPRATEEKSDEATQVEGDEGDKGTQDANEGDEGDDGAEGDEGEEPPGDPNALLPSPSGFKGRK